MAFKTVEEGDVAFETVKEGGVASVPVPGMGAWALCMLVLVEEKGVASVTLHDGGVAFQFDSESV